jgi:hypothetical protein
MAVPAALAVNMLWTDPRYAADDHRHAVADLAANWRPGDVLLVNAGWVYTAIDLYWPRDLAGPDAVLPPDLGDILRLTDAPPGGSSSSVPILHRTGSVDGSDTLGWGSDASDFFAMPFDAAAAALDELGQTHTRLWHYRLYDTVSDPGGKLRAYLESTLPRSWEQTYPGPGYLRVERYDLQGAAESLPDTSVAFADGVRVAFSPPPSHRSAGSYLYGNLTWSVDQAPADENLAVSLRLYDAEGVRVSQVDTQLLPLSPNEGVYQPFALPIPAATPPGVHNLDLILYDPATLVPFAADVPILTQEGAVRLGQVTVTLPDTPPVIRTVLAKFDYIDLVKVALPATLPVGTGEFDSEWTWRPHPSDYQDNYTARLWLEGSTARHLLGEFALGTPNYLSSQWAANYAVRQQERLQLPANLMPGAYTVLVEVVRTSDGHPIPASTRFGWTRQAETAIGTLEVTP